MIITLLALIPALATCITSAPTFTPSKRFSGVLIYSGRRPNLCLSTDFIRGPRPGVGVTLVDCSVALTWDINPGPGYVTVHDNSLVLDAAYNPGNGGFLQVCTYSLHITRSEVLADVSR